MFKSADQLIASPDLKRKLYCSSLRCYLLRKSLFQESRYVLPRMEMATIHLNCQVDYFNFLIPWFCCSCCYNLVLSLMEWVWNKWSVSIRFSGNLSCLKNMFNIYKALLTFGNIGSLIFQTWPFDGKLNNFQEIALIFIFNIFFRYFLVSLTQFI